MIKTEIIVWNNNHDTKTIKYFYVYTSSYVVVLQSIDWRHGIRTLIFPRTCNTFKGTCKHVVCATHIFTPHQWFQTCQLNQNHILDIK